MQPACVTYICKYMFAFVIHCNPRSSLTAFHMQPLNPSEMVYIGGTNHEAVAYLAAAGRSAPEEGAIFAYGGGGVVISTALMHQLTLDMLSCMAAQRSSIGGDDRIGHCVQRIGGKLTIHPGAMPCHSWGVHSGSQAHVWHLSLAIPH